MTKYRCLTCGYNYSPQEGDPDGGVPPGTGFPELPDSWCCPLCGMSKEFFEEIE